MQHLLACCFCQSKKEKEKNRGCSRTGEEPQQEGEPAPRPSHTPPDSGPRTRTGSTKSRQGEKGEKRHNTHTDTGTPFGYQVTRKLSINPGDAIISTTQRDFVQLGGHLGHFHIAGPGALWKQQAKDGEIEAKVLKELNESSLHAYVPDFLGTKEHDGKRWIGMEDVMCHFTDGCGMDIKMGTRTFKEFEVKNQKLREDLYDKMVKQDPSEPTEQENIDKAVTKLRYMTFRERESSSQTLGFRVEAMKIWGQGTNKDFKTLKYKDQVKNALKIYFNPLGRSGIEGFLRELENVTQLLEESTYFKEHEFVGTSLLFVYDRERVGIWLIDFGKTTEISELVEGGQITHDKPWELGNYEDGYFFGLRSLLTVVKEIYDEREEGEEASQYTTIRVN
ncbi:inositol-trisphosphate 3-kinase A-like [Bolinopsis microptera]|uniref:inositol-trisphosphate 3-kinase A-like n=1 Tax=Bolinopsis microptera TaxID=2820187 RepID=UPI003078C4B9